MRDQKVWSLPKLERLHIGWWCMTVTVTWFRSHTKLSKKRDWPPLASNTTVHIQVKLQISFLIAEGQTLAKSYMSVFARSSRICSWTGRALVCVWSLYHTCSCYINMREGSGQSIHAIPFALSVIIGKTSPARKGVSVHKHKVLVHSTSIRATNALLISSQ